MSEPRQSGLRNPEASVRGVGAAALVVQGLVLLLGILPLRVLGAAGGGGTGALVALAVLSFALAGLLRRRWAWWAGGAVPAVLVICGFLVHPSLGVLGLIFGAVWFYVLHVRRTVLG